MSNRIKNCVFTTSYKLIHNFIQTDNTYWCQLHFITNRIRIMKNSRYYTHRLKSGKFQKTHSLTFLRTAYDAMFQFMQNSRVNYVASDKQIGFKQQNSKIWYYYYWYIYINNNKLEKIFSVFAFIIQKLFAPHADK